MTKKHIVLVEQGTEKAGKLMQVDSTGNVTTGISILSGTTAPTSDIGNNGDIYIQYSA